MKCLSVSVIAPSLLLVSTVLSPVLAWSMDEMTDSQLSTTTGQDGITVLIAPPTITGGVTTTNDNNTRTSGLVVGAVVLHDKDGLTGVAGATALSGGALIFGDAKQANAANATGVQAGLFASTPIKLTMDASNGKSTSGTGGTLPVLNVNVALPADLLIRTGDVFVDASNRSIPTIAVGSAGATVANAAIGGTKGAAYKIMNSMDITFGNPPAGQAISFNVQLGNTSQGLVSFGTLKISQINFSDLSFTSPNGGVSPSQLLMTPKITGLDLTGLTIGVVNDIVKAMTGVAAATPVGALLVSDSSFTVDSIELNNVTAGDTSITSSSTGPIAPSMKNAPMGSFGITNMTVTNLKIGVSGIP